MPEERAKVTKMGKWVEITDSRNLDLPLWLVWPVCATFILPDQYFWVISAHVLAKLRSRRADLAVTCVIISAA
ncbi:Uncharacterised protein [Burkholderia pseudomallei]|uniref:hypothetical protein n=1 Tax=Burkholderia pseudomallei TaxID=28450 RepID=UPI000F25C3B9|nr:hypothetical protein [Burkholderia pseudomallei]MWJ56088.1 hypothetical protein [Burkholderia pseudomallei]CAJ3335129.1 Uncharacterised protein [Burkholderia pseudomallei]VBD45443.1 Uncharacterised protein [Burkholderia pseudomallei]VBI59368.1 Uncharacterised protein [Burkholderia pseudomallei]VCS42800.1 Uncharacterised protein [Burkholderia pseudomallei]